MLPTEASKLIKGQYIQTVIKLAKGLNFEDKDIQVSGKQITLSYDNRQENFQCGEIFDENSSDIHIYESILESYINVLAEGFNVNVLFLGGKNCEKGHYLEGGSQQEGMMELFVDQLLRTMDYKKEQNNQNGNRFDFLLRFGAIEIVDENLTDLLGGQGCKIIEGELEGPKIQGAVEYQIKTYQQFREKFYNAKMQRTKFVSEYGSMIKKSSAIYYIELIQVCENIVIISKVNFCELPCLEVLLEDQDKLCQIEGPTLNKSIFAFNNIVKEISTSGYQNITFYESSKLTYLLKDAIGGNSYNISFFFLNYGENLASLASLRLQTYMSKISNYPVLNEGNLLGLLRKYRIEILKSREYAGKEYGQKNDELALKFLNLEQKVVDDNLEKLQKIENNERLAERLGELKEKYNRLINQQREMRDQLYQSEEEKLQLSKTAVNLQIENNELLQQIENMNLNVDNEVKGQEAELIDLRCKEEKAVIIIKQLQDQLEEKLNTEKDLQTELFVIRKNYQNIIDENQKYQERMENIQIELINTNNQVKEQERQIYQVNDSDKQHIKKLQEKEKKYNNLKQENEKTKQAFLELKSELEQVRIALQSEKLKKQEYEIDTQKKHLEFQNNFYEFAQNKQRELENLNHEAKTSINKQELIQKQKESEQKEQQIRSKQLIRKMEELNQKYNDLQQKYKEIQSDNSRLQFQNDEMRNVYRSKLLGHLQNGNNNFLNAREDLLRNYSEREVELLQKIDKFNIQNKSYLNEIEALKQYAMNLKHLAEDWAPLGQPLPEILLVPPPIKINKINLKNQDTIDKQEYNKLKQRNQILEEQLLMMQKEQYKPDRNLLQNKNTNTLKRLQPFQQKQIEQENIQLRDQVQELQEKVKSLSLLSREHDNESVLFLQKENDKLKKQLQKVINQQGLYSYKDQNQECNIGRKLTYYEKVIESLEIERSQLLSRATLAEERWKKLQEKHFLLLKQSKQKILELKEEKKNKQIFKINQIMDKKTKKIILLIFSLQGIQCLFNQNKKANKNNQTFQDIQFDFNNNEMTNILSKDNFANDKFFQNFNFETENQWINQYQKNENNKRNFLQNNRLKNMFEFSDFDQSKFSNDNKTEESEKISNFINQVNPRDSYNTNNIQNFIDLNKNSKQQFDSFNINDSQQNYWNQFEEKKQKNPFFSKNQQDIDMNNFLQAPRQKNNINYSIDTNEKTNTIKRQLSIQDNNTGYNSSFAYAGPLNLNTKSLYNEQNKDFLKQYQKQKQKYQPKNLKRSYRQNQQGIFDPIQIGSTLKIFQLNLQNLIK